MNHDRGSNSRACGHENPEADLWTLTERGRQLIRKARERALEPVAQESGWTWEELRVVRELMRKWAE